MENFIIPRIIMDLRTTLFALICSSLTISAVLSYVNEEDLIYGTFPGGFKWGAATAAYQVKKKTNNQWFDDFGAGETWGFRLREPGTRMARVPIFGTCSLKSLEISMTVLLAKWPVIPITIIPRMCSWSGQWGWDITGFPLHGQEFFLKVRNW